MGKTTYTPLVKQLCDIYVPSHRYGLYKLVTQLFLKFQTISKILLQQLPRILKQRGGNYTLNS